MDATDKKLLELMQIDAKKTTKELSSKLNLSVTAVYERIKKLEREGIISKYATILDKTKEGGDLGLLFNIRTSTPEFGYMDVKIHNKKCDTIFRYRYPIIVSTP